MGVYVGRDENLRIMEENYIRDLEEEAEDEVEEELLDTHVYAKLQQVFGGGNGEMMLMGEEEGMWSQQENEEVQELPFEGMSLDDEFRGAYEEAEYQIAALQIGTPEKRLDEQLYQNEALVQEVVQRARERTLKELEEDKILVLRKVG